MSDQVPKEILRELHQLNDDLYGLGGFDILRMDKLEEFYRRHCMAAEAQLATVTADRDALRKNLFAANRIADSNAALQAANKELADLLRKIAEVLRGSGMSVSYESSAALNLIEQAIDSKADAALTASKDAQ